MGYFQQVAALLAAAVARPSLAFVRQKYVAKVQGTAIRLRLADVARDYIIVRNLEPTNVLQIAFTAVASSNRNRPTTGFVDINPGEEWYETGSTNQVWVRPKVDGANCLLEVQTATTKA